MDRSQEVAVGFTLTERHFSTPAEARAESAARGWHVAEYGVAAGVPHRAASPACGAVFGFPAPPDSMSLPIKQAHGRAARRAPVP